MTTTADFLLQDEETTTSMTVEMECVAVNHGGDGKSRRCRQLTNCTLSPTAIDHWLAKLSQRATGPCSRNAGARPRPVVK